MVRLCVCTVVERWPTLRSGQPIPRVKYSPEEVAVWGTVLRQLKGLLPQHACKEVRWLVLA